MFASRIDQLFKEVSRDRRHFEELLAAYRHPDPAIGATDESVPGFAYLMLDQAVEWASKYEALADQQDAPSELRMLARANRKLAAELLDLLSDLARPFVEGLGKNSADLPKARGHESARH